MIVLRLPYPPSVNSIWIRARKGMRRSENYLAWIEQARWAIKQQKLGVGISGGYSLSVDITRPDRRKRDIDNTLKVISDALVSTGLVEDDCLCECITARWVHGEPGVLISIKSMEEA